MIFIVFAGVLMSYFQVDLLFDFMDSFSVCGPFQYYDAVRPDGSYGFQQCYGFDYDYVSHARRNLRDLFFCLFVLPYIRFAALTFIKTGI